MQATQQRTDTQTTPPGFGRVLGKLFQNDVKLVGRDSFMAGMVLYILLVCAVLRFVVPGLSESLMANQDFDLTPYYPLMVSYMALMMGPVLAGTLIGFLILDERDDNTLKAMLVTPMPLSYYMIYRMGIPTLLGLLLVIIEVLVMNLTTLPLWQLVLIAAGGALIAPLVALFMANFAANKVQGFAMLKIIGSSALIAVAAWFFVEPVQFIAGVYPPYWMTKAFWMATAGDGLWWLPLLIGIVMMGGINLWLLRRFTRIAYAD